MFLIHFQARAFFSEWVEASPEKKQEIKRSYRGHPLVRASHGLLIDAYNNLMQQYPDETQHNRKAFFDHLCALDFI